MACYTVHLKSRIADPDLAREKAVFVRDGWNIAAFGFGPFWLIAKGHAVIGIVALLLQLALLGIVAALGLPPGFQLAVMALISLSWGLEGASLRRLALRLSRHHEAGLVIAPSEDEAERRFFAGEERLDAPRSGKATPEGFVPHGPANPVMGLFPQARGPA
ncbi:DUF2628 domain-containing protein [Rhabdaerophilum sp. SD176]|uniref:DUF2628 domain-containing protein n=1 Tax=Rhabdaerophilum sp. SD176 TaxID=2983548 RepID=UPI0024DF5BAB|nr:DUF2628 domain-containing protein [Rhabdaerophilum sp. SD176]